MSEAGSLVVKLSAQIAEFTSAMDKGVDSLPANLEMEKLVGLKSLGAIIDYLESALNKPATESKPVEVSEAYGKSSPLMV